MQIRATVKYSPILPKARLFKYDKARHSIASGMTRHWKTLMRSGTMADGEPLPVSDRTGLPLGIGNGTIIEGWKAVDDGAIQDELAHAGVVARCGLQVSCRPLSPRSQSLSVRQGRSQSGC